jgi:hypothetical protein
MSMKTRLVVTLGLLALAAASVSGLFAREETENVPVDRLVRNLEQRVVARPDDVRLLLNLARVHAMAFATKSDTAVASKKTGDAWFEPWKPGAWRDVRVRREENAAQGAMAKAHLDKAIAGYEAVLKLDPPNLIAQLGRAWLLERSGDKPRAIAAYRALMVDAYRIESIPGEAGARYGEPVMSEAVDYLIPLLDAVKDADEIADLRKKVKVVRGILRAITPIAIPLRDGLDAADLSDHSARVKFDADGSGLDRTWTWITLDAAWLVFDRHDRRTVNSALQLFGSVTFWLFWQNGYEALDALDDNGDGELRGGELTGLALWHDANTNGRSESGEVRPLAAHGITALSTRFIWDEGDPFSAAHSPAGVTFAGGTTRPTFDLWLRRH